MEYLPVFGLMFVVVAIISWRWVNGIDYMQRNHPDYKGEDFLNWDDDIPPIKEDKSEQKERNSKSHYEGEF